MLNNLKRLNYSRRFGVTQRGLRLLGTGLSLAAASTILIVFFQSACVLKKSKVSVESSPPVRLVFLPFNTPAGNKDLRWTAMAVPILMAQISKRAPALDPVPLWQVMPAAIESAGNSRSFTEESAAYVANWIVAKWSVMGELTPAKNGVSLMVDFIPAKSNLVAFRYTKTGSLDSVGPNLRIACEQFLRYLVAKPLEARSEKLQNLTSLRKLAETLDREYGWSVETEPGKAQEAVSSLVRTDERLAHFLFSPTLYSVLGPVK